MTTGEFRYIDPATFTRSDVPFVKPWAKVDIDATSFARTPHRRSVTDIRGAPGPFGTDISGFSVHHAPCREATDFDDDSAVRTTYYADVEALLRAQLPGISRVVMFDHTIRRHEPDAPRQPVMQVHVDQTPAAAAARVRRHVQPAAEAEDLLRRRFQIINVWRPIGHPATDFPLAVVDWRTMEPDDLVAVDLLYPVRAAADGEPDDGDDRGKEVLPDPASAKSAEGYEVKGE